MKPHTADFFGKFQRFIYWKVKSIGDHLVRSDIAPKNKVVDLRTQYTAKRGRHPCHNCQNCASMKGTTNCHPMKGFEIPIKNNFTCSSNNVVYMLKYPCGKAYIGQTSRSIKTRLGYHRFNIRTFKDKKEIEGKNTSMGKARWLSTFAEMRHTVSDLRWCVIEKMMTLRLEIGYYKGRCIGL